ncbi:MAG: porphobilinogen synthase [Gemmatimonadetes bacterium]|nr:porphobilinogen synthase [Gemmatimonadota bacterium]
MFDLPHRPRRLRSSEAWRRLVRETRLSVDDLILPLFVREGEGVREPIASMPGCARLSVDELVKEAAAVHALGIPGVILFGIPDHKDAHGTSGYAPDGIIPRAVQALKREVPDLLVWADVCLCEYTDHGHCGVLEDGRVLNDPTVELLAEAARVYADAGADAVCPSDMMDGRVGAIRATLDDAGHTDTVIVSYAAKYASAYYGPFRDAAGSAPSTGDRKAYQMDPPNGAEALREIELDINEGADIIMVKPALAYLDIVRRAAEFPVPVAAYNVSGEYAMIKAAAAAGHLDEQRVVLETLTSMRRAGAQILLTYHAKDVAEWIG